MPHGLSLREKLEVTKRAGFDYLEVSVDESDEKLGRLMWGGDRRREVVRASRDLGVPIGSICLSGHRKYPFGSRDAAVRTRSLDIMERALVLARDWDVGLIQLAGYDVYYGESGEDTRAWFGESLARSVGMAAEYGIILAFETMETPFMDTVAKAMEYVRGADSPFLQIYPDLGNLTNAAVLYGHGIADDLKLGDGHIAALHLKETAPGRYRDVPYGTGHVDFAAGIAAARDLGVTRFVGEFWDDGKDWLGQVERANMFLRGFLDS